MSANWLVEKMCNEGVARIINHGSGEVVEMDEFEASARKLHELRGSPALEEQLETEGGTVTSSIRYTAAIDVAIATLRSRSKTWAA